MDLNETHERVFYSTILIIEQKLDDMVRALQVYQHPPDDVLRTFNNDIGHEQREAVEQGIAQMKEGVKSFCTAFGLEKKEKNSLRKELEIKATFLWEHLADSTVKKISGYGALPDDVKVTYEEHINDLIKISENLITICKKTNQ